MKTGRLNKVTMRALVQMLSIIVLAASVLTFTACKKQTRRTTSLTTTPAVKADSVEAQASFDEAFESLKQGKYKESQQAFKLVQSTHEGDSIAPVAELYAVRAELGKLVVQDNALLSPDASTEQVRALVTRLESLAQERRVDERVRWSARLYEAMLWTILGEQTRAMDVLEKYPSASINALVLERDRPMAWLLLLSSMQKTFREEEAFVAAAMLFQSTRSLEDSALGDVQQWPEYARQVGLGLALNEVDESSLQMQFLTSDNAFLQGLAGWALIVRQKDKDADPAALQNIYAQSSPALLDIGAVQQVTELNSYLSTISTEERIIVGALVPMSGESKGVGARVLRGMLLAQQAYNGDSNSAQLTLLFRDASAPAEDNMRWFEEHNALAVVGPINKESAAVYSALAEKSKIVLLPLVPASTEKKQEPATSDAWSFSYFLDIQAEARAVARTSYQRYGDRSAAIIWPDVGYGQVMASAFRDEFTSLGGTIVAEVEYPRQDTEFARTAAKVSKAKPDAIFIADTGQKVSQVVSFLAKANVWGVSGKSALNRKSRLQTHYLGTSLWQDPFLLQQATSYIQGATIPVWYSSVSKDEESREFRARYEKIYRSGEPSIYEAFAYDAVSLLEEIVVKRGAQDRDAVREQFLVGQWEGVTGRVIFKKNGESQHELRFITVDDGEFVGLELEQKTPPKQLAP